MAKLAISPGTAQTLRLEVLELEVAALLVDTLAEVARNATNAAKSDISLATAPKVVDTEVASRIKAATAVVTAEVVRARLATLVVATATCPEIVLKDKSATTV